MIPRERWRALFLFSLLVGGCGPRHPPTYPVQGSVVFDTGEPVSWGTIEFYCAESRIAARGKIASDGTFRLSTYDEGDGAVAGKHLVTVAQAELLGQPHEHSHAPLKAVPKRFSDPQTSRLEFTVEPGSDNACRLTIEP
jgi:hypothetical protein